jgi:hypothetical protein
MDKYSLIHKHLARFTTNLASTRQVEDKELTFKNAVTVEAEV